jgi:C4-dicarboxylate transporter DctM subunit
MLFAGVTGAGTADTAAIGSLLIPAMKEEGYTPQYSAAVTSASSVIGPIIPPSISAVIYGVSAQVSVGAVLLAGAIPGAILGLSQMVLVAYHARKYHFKRGRKSSLPEIASAFKEALPSLLIPVIIIGGILTGYFTPTEAATMAVLIAFILGFVIYRTIKVNDLPGILLKTAVTTGGVAMIVGMAAAFGWVLTIEQIPQKATQILVGLSDNRYVILLIVNCLLLFIGTFMETTASIIIMTPILLPVMTQIGVDPIHFGAIMIVNLGIGLATPPLGLCLFISAIISKASLEDISKSIIGFLLVSVGALMLITYYPPFSMLLPNLLLK